MSENKYEKLSEEVIGLIGGEENISYFTHCVTRLRFTVKDKSIVDKETISDFDGVVSTQWSGNQLQVIIGQSVGEVYKMIKERNNLENVETNGHEKEESEENSNNEANQPKKGIGSIIMGMLDAIAGSISPIIPMMIGAGLIKAFAMIANVIGILPVDGSTYQALMLVGDGFVYFLPVFLGATSAQKFGVNQGLGMLMGTVLINPSFISMVEVGEATTIFGLPIYLANYTNSVIPVILSVYVMSLINKWLSKVTPELFKSFLVPTLTIAITLPLMLVVVAPIGFYIGTYVTAAIIWMYESIGFVGVAILATVFPLLVMTGMHSTMTSYWIPTLTQLGYEPFFLPANFISNSTQAAACVGVALKTKDKKLRSEALSCALTCFVAGVTEPALFGINLKYKKPLYAAMAGNLAGGLIVGLARVVIYQIPGSGGIFGFINFFSGENTGNFIWFLIAIVVSMIITVILTYILGIDEKKGEVSNV